jgi:hypothetical protein
MGLFDVIGDIAKFAAPFTGPYAPFVAAAGDLLDGVDPGDGDRGTIVASFTSEDDTDAGGGVGLGGVAGLLGGGSGLTSVLGSVGGAEGIAGIFSGGVDTEEASQLAGLAAGLLNNSSSGQIAPQ